MFLYDHRWVLIFGIILQINVQTIASYISGINVNYQLYPPPLPSNLSFMMGPDYRFKFYTVLAVVGLVKKLFIQLVASFLVSIGLGTKEPKVLTKEK